MTTPGRTHTLNRQNPDWKSSSAYQVTNTCMTLDRFREIIDLLLRRPDLNSTHLYRADILYDSSGILETPDEKEHHNAVLSGKQSDIPSSPHGQPPTADVQCPPAFRDYSQQRIVLRRLIPRKPQLDCSLDQSCFIYSKATDTPTPKQLVVLVPHVTRGEDIPWYHPPIKALAYHFEGNYNTATLSLHYQAFHHGVEPITDRGHRTFLSLLRTFVRLSKQQPPPAPLEAQYQRSLLPSERILTPAMIKDTIVPQHVLQDTYTRLKQIYAADLCNRWVESTEPSKHVFEDLAIAAFLIELWRIMYNEGDFPGFVDVACGNGVLVYVLIKEGYPGSGFDARRRKTWSILDIDKHLEESICIPAPFWDAMPPQQSDSVNSPTYFSGRFAPRTFIISNHADELTPWTPLLAALSSPANPHPFLAIPCCSHALSGAKRRYTLTDIDLARGNQACHVPHSTRDDEAAQPSAGDLKALRAQKQTSAQTGDEKSQYACLTKKVAALAEETGQEVELTLMRIPSTRNIGIVGNRRRASNRICSERDTAGNGNRDRRKRGTETDIMELIDGVIRRECAVAGGVDEAAKTWLARATKLHSGSGRGKVNWGGAIGSASTEA